MRILDWFIDFLTANPFEEEDDTHIIYVDFKRRVNQIKRENQEKILEEKIKPFILMRCLMDTNTLMPEKQLNVMSMEAFKFAKKQGLIDEFNNVIGEKNEK